MGNPLEDKVFMDNIKSLLDELAFDMGTLGDKNLDAAMTALTKAWDDYKKGERNPMGWETLELE